MITGTLSWDDRRSVHRIDVEGGGFWFVSMPRAAVALLGRRVAVDGTRTGFNILDDVTVVGVDSVNRP
ncbi:DUF5818 domain-containing protein [Sphingomonas beigongshangi]|uniref:DUF5818 domain-containing protein n=1 Tax=Sphingomonas beigongshangi TaxID=2782540 RepID=UPI001AEE92EC